MNGARCGSGLKPPIRDRETQWHGHKTVTTQTILEQGIVELGSASRRLHL